MNSPLQVAVTLQLFSQVICRDDRDLHMQVAMLRNVSTTVTARHCNLGDQLSIVCNSCGAIAGALLRLRDELMRIERDDGVRVAREHLPRVFLMFDLTRITSIYSLSEYLNYVH